MLPIIRLSLVASIALGLLSTAAQPSSAADVVLENVVVAKSGTQTAMRRIEVLGTNLSRDEVAKLFAGETPNDELMALFSKMTAQRVTIPEILLSNGHADISFHDFQAAGVGAGKIAKFSLAGLNGTLSSEGGKSGTVKAGRLEMEQADVSRLVSAAREGNLAGGVPRVSSTRWNGLELTFADADTPTDAPGGNLVRITMGAMKAQGTYDGLVPLKGAGEVTNVVVEFPKASKFHQAMAAFGYERIEIGFRAAVSYDKAKQVYALDDVTINGANAGSLELRMQFGSFDPGLFTGDKATQEKLWKLVTLIQADLTVVNGGLFEKAVTFAARQQKKQPEELKREWSAMSTQLLPLIMGGNPASLKIADALSKFILAPKSLTLAVQSRGGPVKLVDLSRIRDPQSLLSQVEVSASAGQ